MTRTSTISKLWLLGLAFILPQIITASALICKNGYYASLNGNGEATAQASDFVLSTGSCCNGGETFEISLDFGTTYQPSITFDCDQLGVSEVTVKATDCFGIENICHTFIVVQDNQDVCISGCGGCCKPEVRFKPVILALSDDGTVAALADWFNDGSFSNCTSGPVQVSFSSNANDVLKTFTCNELGTQLIELWVTDAAGNQSVGSVFAVIQDAYGECPGFMGCFPVPVVLNGIVTSLGADGTVCISADAYNAGCHTDPCNAGSAFSLSYSQDPNDTEVCYDCNDLGTQSLELYITDDQGVQNYISTFIVIQDNQGYCDPSAIIAAPNNDNVLTAPSLDQLVNASCSSIFDNKSATSEPNEIAPPLGECDAPDTWCDANGAEKTLWFQFVAPQAEKLTITATGIETQFAQSQEGEKSLAPAMNTQLALWEAEDAAAIKAGNATLVAANDDHPSVPNGGSLLVGECLEAGKTYFLQVDGHDGAEGVFELNVVTEGTVCVSSTQHVATNLIDFSVQPNPAIGDVNINLPETLLHLEKEILLMDVAGKLTASKRIAPSVGKASLDVSKLPEGVYFMHIKAGNASVRPQKIVVMK